MTLPKLETLFKFEEKSISTAKKNDPFQSTGISLNNTRKEDEGTSIFGQIAMGKLSQPKQYFRFWENNGVSFQQREVTIKFDDKLFIYQKSLFF